MAYGLPCPPGSYLVGKKTTLVGKKTTLAHIWWKTWRDLTPSGQENFPSGSYLVGKKIMRMGGSGKQNL